MICASGDVFFADAAVVPEAAVVSDAAAVDVASLLSMDTVADVVDDTDRDAAAAPVAATFGFVLVSSPAPSRVADLTTLF